MTDLGSFRSGSEPYSSLITRSAVTIEAIGSPVDFSATDHLPWDCGQTIAGSAPPTPGRPPARAQLSWPCPRSPRSDSRYTIVDSAGPPTARAPDVPTDPAA